MSKATETNSPFVDPKFDSGIFPGYEEAADEQVVQDIDLPEPLDMARRTLAQETGMVLSGQEFKDNFREAVRELDRPTTVHDLLNGEGGNNRVQNRTWLRVPRPVTNGSRS